MEASVDYPLENLGPERFQHLCQDLLTKEHPRVQCFPVAQPDGGRDAVVFLTDGPEDKFSVFQVKYARKPHAEAEPHKWLLAIVEDEAPKVRELIPRGAIQYVLMTNIPGTAHLDTGSIDKLNATLTEKLGIPSLCWWRDDINRRLDNAWDLKWVYPEIMAGPDFLRVVIESGLSEHRERRSATVRAFLRAQYDMDEEVRFKQVELHNKLLDLFVDVPIALRETHADRQQLDRFQAIVAQALSHTQNPQEMEFEGPGQPFDTNTRLFVSHEEGIGAATLLISASMQTVMPHVVIEGAPGQGKSTIAQYICQLHRMRLLDEAEALKVVAEEHSRAPVRLPIKVDLRDFALWLGKKDPFNIDQVDSAPVNWNKSLDSFLAALISHQSGGTHFTTDDLLAVFRISAVLLVFDGLDEVADMTRRHEVVDEIVRGVQRLEENAASMQAIVTSRPAAFANSPGMPHSKYPHLQLLSLNRSLIMAYAERWLRAGRLDTKQSAEFRVVLKDKLDQPHLRDLARNPMQLAILLSLVHTRGASLPDKRTALYDYYIDLFFSREAEKSAIVRNHRELLIDIHRHLAWLLHSDGEQGNARGSVPQDQLQLMVAEYLRREGHDPGLAKELFTGMVERVVALVSRVEGTFEFEVQPLREYFAACHLYYTAPQSSPGKERSGSKPDRFDAIARNFYWLNVTRFYAGCYSKGELPSLVERLQELTNEQGFKTISYPCVLAATLLGDWVFTQNPRSVQQLIDIVLGIASLRYVLAPFESRRYRPGVHNPLVLPPRCGREELIKRCFEMLSSALPRDLAQQLLSLLRANAESHSDVMDAWMAHTRAATREKRVNWLEHGLHLGMLSTIELDRLYQLLPDSGVQVGSPVLSILFRARRLDYLHSSEQVFEDVVSLILERRVTAQPSRRIESPLDALSHALDASRYAFAFRDRQPVRLADHLDARNRAGKLMWSQQLVTGTESYSSYRSCIELARIAEGESQKSTIEWATDISPWNQVIESARSIWGDRWAVLCLANVAAGIRSSAEKCAESSDLLDPTRPIARRIRFARLRPGAHKWWGTQFKSAASENDIHLLLLVALTWAKASTLVANIELLDLMLTNLGDEQWQRLFFAARRCASLARVQEERGEDLDTVQLPECLSLRFAAVLTEKLGPAASHPLYERYIKSQRTEDPVILEFVQREALDIENFGTESWTPNLELVQRCYDLGEVSEPFAFHRQRNIREPGLMPLDIAQTVLDAPDHFPSFLVVLSEERCRQDVSSKATAVGAIAEREGWFSPP